MAVAFNRMAESLTHMEQLRKRMMVDVAHELRTPLTNIQGYLEALTDGVVSPSRETFELLQSSSNGFTGEKSRAPAKMEEPALVWLLSKS